MKKIVIIYGSIAGLIVSVSLVATVAFSYKSGNFEGSMLLGYASMFLAFSLIFIAVKSYRDRYNAGIISFGKAFTTGLYITLIASTIYVIAWLIGYNFFVPDFADKYAAHMIDKLKAGGASQVEIDKLVTEMARFAVMYKKPLFNALVTYTEILPVGLLISVISAFILKRKSKPVSATTDI